MNVDETVAMLALQRYGVTVVRVKVTTSGQPGGQPMATRRDVNPETSISHLLAFYLRFLREGEGLSQEDLGDFVGTDKFTVAKWEATTRHPNRQQAAKLDKRWKTGGLLVAMVALELKERKHQATSLDYRELEGEASTIKVYEATVVPALLQTPEYAEAVIRATGAMPDEVQERVRARLSRQELLTGPRPPLLIVAVPESVLEWPVGGPAVMAGQLAHLLEMGRSTNVGVRVISRTAGAHLGLDGSFTVLSGPTGHIGYTEAPGAERFTFAIEAGPYLDRFDRIGIQALSDYESAALIDQKRKEYANAPG
jgi:transcriptional regulator with XRE-family HTH domain